MRIYRQYSGIVRKQILHKVVNMLLIPYAGYGLLRLMVADMGWHLGKD